MKKVILGISLVAITPVALLFALILTVASYHSNYLSSLLASRSLNTIAYAALPPSSSQSFSAEINQQDARAETVRQFLHKYGSPLEPYAQDIVDAADQYNLDYRLVPAIAMQESNLCLKIPENSNNCWGFGIYGGRVTKFADYKEAIYTVTKTLATKYKAQGLITPDQIMTVWTPSSNGSWAFSVNHFMEKLK